LSNFHREPTANAAMAATRPRTLHGKSTNAARVYEANPVSALAKTKPGDSATPATFVAQYKGVGQLLKELHAWLLRSTISIFIMATRALLLHLKSDLVLTRNPPPASPTAPAAINKDRVNRWIHQERSCAPAGEKSSGNAVWQYAPCRLAHHFGWLGLT
jgi:hypothetical protein